MPSKQRHILIGIMFAALLVAIPLLKWKTARPQPAVLGSVPEFSLFDQNGKSFGRAQMLGKIWVVDFIFTSCADICPTLTQRMKALQDELQKQSIDDVGLLSLSVDPQRDTPEVLRQYSARFGVDEKRWKFLTGESKAMEAAVVEGFKMTMSKQAREGDTGVFDIMHGDRFVLVDRQGQIRGYYEMSDAPSIERLRADWQVLR